MHLEVTFKNIKARDEIKKRALALHKKLEKFLDPASEGTLVVAVEHGNAILELRINAYGDVHVAVEEDPELRTALDKAFHTMEIQLRRGKEKRVANRRDVEPEDGFVTDSPSASADGREEEAQA